MNVSAIAAAAAAAEEEQEANTSSAAGVIPGACVESQERVVYA
jgi:hypothetical protein